MWCAFRLHLFLCLNSFRTYFFMIRLSINDTHPQFQGLSSSRQPGKWKCNALGLGRVVFNRQFIQSLLCCTILQARARLLRHYLSTLAALLLQVCTCKPPVHTKSTIPKKSQQSNLLNPASICSKRWITMQDSSDIEEIHPIEEFFSFCVDVEVTGGVKWIKGAFRNGLNI